MSGYCQQHYFISHVNSFLGSQLVETLRNDNSNDQDPHCFSGKALRNEPLPNGPVTPLKDTSVHSLVQQALASDVIIYELDHNDLQEVDIIIKGTPSLSILLLLLSLSILY